MAKCDFEHGKITCARDAVKVIVVRRSGRNIARWLSCPHHHVWFWRLAMELSKDKGGSIHTQVIAEARQRDTAISEYVHPYLRISRALHDRMNRARQRRGQPANAFITEAIEKSITEIEEGR